MRLLSVLTFTILWAIAAIAQTVDSSVAGTDSVVSTVSGDSAGGEKTVYVVTLAGDVEPAMAAFLARALKTAGEDPDALVIIEMDTFGGRVDAALQIVDTLLFMKTGPKIAYVKTKAISAGALIALACDKLVMKNGTTIGDCQPITYSNEGPQTLGEKFQSPLRAKFRALAQRNGYPQTLSEAMVSPDMLVYKVVFPDTTVYLDSTTLAELPAARIKSVVSKQTVVARGRLLTMNDNEAVELGFSKMSVSGIEEMLTNMGIKKYRIVRLEKNWSELFVRLLGTLSPILMMVGFAALYIEYKTPGFGIFGITGLALLGLVFFGQYMVGLANYTELLLLIIGVLLLGAELFVLPGFGIAGILGISCIAAGLILSMQGFVIPDPKMPWQMDELMRNLLSVVGSFVIAALGGLIVLRYVFPKISIGGTGPYLSATLVGSHTESEDAKSVKVGDEGVAITPLRPSGKVRIGELTHDAVTEGEFLARDTRVVIAKISGSRVIVETKRDAHA